MDNAFNSAPFAAFTTAELRAKYATYSGIPGYGATAEKMQAEIDRRAARDAGDTSVMTEGERLRFVKAGGSL